jgi:trk system potassium uptake protein TrkA
MYIVIAGAGLVGQSLAERLVENRHDVVVIDREKAICEQVATDTGALVLHGSATDVGILEQAGMSKADVAIATMRVDADNLSFSLLAKSYDVPRVIARMRNPRYESAYRMAGVSTTVRVVDMFVSQILLDIEEPDLRQLATFGPHNAAIVVASIPDDAAVHGKTIGQIATDSDFPAQCVVSGIYRPENQQFLIPRGPAEIRAGDRVFLVANQKDLRRAFKYLRRSDRRRASDPGDETP